MKEKEPPKLNRIDFKSGKFVANGVEYYIQPNELNPRRFQVYQELSIKTSLGSSFDEIFGSFKKIYEWATSGNDMLKNFNGIAKESYTRMMAIKEVKSERVSNVLAFCALFCNRADEDITKYDERIMLEKVNDFQDSGYPMSDFFLLSSMLISGYKESYDQLPEKSHNEKADPPKA